MAKVGCSTYHRGADGYYRTMEIGTQKQEKRPKKVLSERAVRCAKKREADAEVCRKCTKKVCKGSPECIEKQRKIQEAERAKEDGKDGEADE